MTRIMSPVTTHLALMTISPRGPFESKKFLAQASVQSITSSNNHYRQFWANEVWLVSGFSGGDAAGSSRGNNGGGGVDGFIDGDGGGRIYIVITLAFSAVNLLWYFTCRKVSLDIPGI